MRTLSTFQDENSIELSRNDYKSRCAKIFFACCFLIAFTPPVLAEAGISSIARAKTLWITSGYALVKSGDSSVGPDSIGLCRAHEDRVSFFTYENHVGVDEILANDLFEVLIHDRKLLFREAGEKSYFILDLTD